MRLTEVMALADQLAGCERTPEDSQVYLDGDVRRVLFGIDVDVGELLLARELGLDGVIAHHPIGSRAGMNLPNMIDRHEEQMVAVGIPRARAHQAMLERKAPVERVGHSKNYDRVVDAARLLGMPLMNIHLAADLVSRQYFIDFVGQHVDGRATRVGALIEELKTIPEMEVALAQPQLWLGKGDNPVGRWVVQMAAGTNGGAPIFSTYYEHGINTILAMHVDPADLNKLEAMRLPAANLIITGHMPSDSIGINRLIDALQERGVEVIPGSGVIRV